MFGKRTDKAESTNLTDNMVNQTSGQFNQVAGKIGKEVENITHETEKLLRPINRLMAFASGVVIGGLRGMSLWAGRGAMVGLVIGVAAMIMTAGSAPFLGVSLGVGGWTGAGAGMALVGWGAGLIAGALAGGVIGGIKGGPERLAYEERKAKYADELALQGAQQPRSAGVRRPTVDKAAYKEYRESHSDGQFDRFQQRFDLAGDSTQSWTDRVSDSGSQEMGR